MVIWGVVAVFAPTSLTVFEPSLFLTCSFDSLPFSPSFQSILFSHQMILWSPFCSLGSRWAISKRSGGLAFYCHFLPWACQSCFPLYLLVKQLLNLQDWRPVFPTPGGRVMLLSGADTSCRCPFSEPTSREVWLDSEPLRHKTVPFTLRQDSRRCDRHTPLPGL